MASYVTFCFLLLISVWSVRGDVNAWCVCPSTVHVLQRSTCQSLSNISSQGVEWNAMRGELENKQILVDTRGWDPAANLTASVSLIFTDLVGSAGRIASGNLSWWQVGYVYCKATPTYEGSGGGWRPDPLLSPANDQVLLEVGVTQPLWIQISVPRNAPNGLFLGSIKMTIQVPKSNPQVIIIPMQLTVWDITIPKLKDANFPAVFSFAPGKLNQIYGSKSTSVVWDFIDLFIQQRVAGKNLYDGTVENPQYSQYYAQHGVQWLSMISIEQIPLGKSFPGLKLGARCNISDSDLQTILSEIQDGVTCYQQLGILNNMFVYGFDEAPSSCLPTIQKVWSAVKAKWPQIRTMSTLNWAPPTTLMMDAWVKSYHIYNETEAAKWLKAGRQQWWYHCLVPEPIEYMNTFVERPLLETRLLFWLAGKHDVAGWLYYSVAQFGNNNQAIQKLNGTARTNYDPAVYPNGGSQFWNGDGNFVYPGPHGPVPSTRLHNLRDGFEDAELFRMLSLDECAPLVDPVVRNATDYTLDPVLMEKQRIATAKLVEAKLLV